MLQRAASNAYSWWWASHIRTKQSKWLDNDIQEMEERVKSMIKLIEEDADSFAKKAEMYYRRRPELINFVEESFRAYRALADRYDHISGELHKANHTIAIAFPDHVQIMEDEDDDRYPNALSTIDSAKILHIPLDSNKLPKPPPELPRISSRNKAGESHPTSKKTHQGSVTSQQGPEKAQEEIDRLQKGILVLQTEKEFVKSSYERWLAKYSDIERQMTEMQEEVSHLQDECGTSSVIDDDEARALMAASALKSCEDTFVCLREQQKRSVQEARLESERIKVAERKLKALKGEDAGEVTEKDKATRPTTLEEEIGNLKHKRLELQSVCAKVKEHFEMGSGSSVIKLAEKIDELVDKDVILEVKVSSQTARIERLKLETNELQKHIRGLEEDKMNRTCDADSMSRRLEKAEEELQRVQDLERSVNDEKGVLQTHFTEVCHSLNDLSEKLQSPKHMDQLFGEEDADENILEGKEVARTNQMEPEDVEGGSTIEDDGGTPDWQQLLHKYASILHNYKETKDMLTEIEKKNQECHSETLQQIQELRNANAMKDKEIRTLKQRFFTFEPSNLDTSGKLEGLFVVAPDEECDVSEQFAKEVVKLCQVEQSTSPIEQNFRAEIDTLLEDNLDFWLRFSTSYHQIQSFEYTFKELQTTIEKVREAKNIDGSDIVRASLEQVMRLDSSPACEKLRELHTELQVWLEKNELLQRELQSRFSSLCSIQEEISKASKASEGEEVQFIPYQAAKFQGEVINMQQENKKVAKELQTGLDHVRHLQKEVGMALSKLHESFRLSGSKRNHPLWIRHLSSKSRIPLRAFLFGAKPKKPSIFKCNNLEFQKQYSDLSAHQIP